MKKVTIPEKYIKWIISADELDDITQLFSKILAEMKDEEYQITNGASKVAWSMFKDEEMNRQKEIYAIRVNNNRFNGKKGGRPRKNTKN